MANTQHHSSWKYVAFSSSSAKAVLAGILATNPIGLFGSTLYQLKQSKFICIDEVIGWSAEGHIKSAIPKNNFISLSAER